MKYLVIFAVSALYFAYYVDAETDITIGYPVTPTQFPWYVVIEPMMADDTVPYTCAGTLILSQWILASATCGYFNAVQFRIKFSSVYDYDNPENIMYTSEYFPHNEYDWTTSENNIALLRLPTAVKFNSYVQSIQLPGLAYNKRDHVGDEVYYVGVIDDARVDQQQRLRWSTKKIISREQCMEITNPIESELCAVDHGKNSTIPILCDPVIGSAIAVYENNSWTQIGIASITGCNTFPSIFTNIPLYYNWINEIVEQNYAKSSHQPKKT